MQTGPGQRWEGLGRRGPLTAPGLWPCPGLHGQALHSRGRATSLLRGPLGVGRGASPPRGACRPLSPFRGSGAHRSRKAMTLPLATTAPSSAPWPPQAPSLGLMGLVGAQRGPDTLHGLLSGCRPGGECAGAPGSAGRTGQRLCGLEAAVMSCHGQGSGAGGPHGPDTGRSVPGWRTPGVTVPRSGTRPHASALRDRRKG